MLSREEVAFNLEREKIVFDSVTDRTSFEVILVCESGRLFLFDLVSGALSEIGKLFFEPYKLDLQLHSFGAYVCITQKNGTLGIVLNLEDPHFEKRLERGDYCAYVSRFPIAFYSRDDKNYLIHGTDWNRLDITCLETDELLTDRIVDYDTDSNYFDYFHSSLLVSPRAKSFISNGWHWHPYGNITYYSIDEFLVEFELSHQDLELTTEDDPEDAPYELGWDRPVCWLDERTLGIGYNRAVGYDGKRTFSSEILTYNLTENAIVRRVPFDGFRITSGGEVSGSLYFDREKKHFMGLNKVSGLLVTDSDGGIVAKHSELLSHEYSGRHKVWYKIDNKSQRIELVRINDRPSIQERE